MYTLLIAEDEDLIRESLVSHISWNKIGFQVIFNARNGKEAIEYLSCHAVDVVLTDIKMPQATGIDIAKLVFENKLNTRVIFLSGYKEFDLAMSAIEYGVRSYLLKPTKLDDIYNTFLSLKTELDEEHRKKNELDEINRNYTEAILAMQEQALTELLFVKNNSNQSNYKKSGIEFTHRNIILFILEIIEYDKFIKTVWQFESDLLYIAIKNIISKTTTSGIIAYALSLQDGKICILMNFQDILALDTHLEQLYKNLIEFLRLEIKIHRSEIFCDPLLISDFFKKIRPGSNEKNAHFLQTHPPQRETEPEYPLDQEYLLLSFLNSLDIEKVYDILSSIFEPFNTSIMGKETINAFCSELLVGLTRYLKNINARIQDILGYRPDHRTDFTLIGSYKDILDWFFKLCTKIIEYLQTRNEDVDIRIITIIKEYIEVNIDRDISLNNIAELVHLNPVYVSKFFKKHTGVNFIDYLIQVRMEKAKEFLCTLALRAGQISEMVGYRSDKHFFKTFKAYTGLTPLEYRKRFTLKGTPAND